MEVVQHIIIGWVLTEELWDEISNAIYNNEDHPAIVRDENGEITEGSLIIDPERFEWNRNLATNLYDGRNFRVPVGYLGVELEKHTEALYIAMNKSRVKPEHQTEIVAMVEKMPSSLLTYLGDPKLHLITRLD